MMIAYFSFKEKLMKITEIKVTRSFGGSPLSRVTVRLTDRPTAEYTLLWSCSVAVLTTNVIFKVGLAISFHFCPKRSLFFSSNEASLKGGRSTRLAYRLVYMVLFIV